MSRRELAVLLAGALIFSGLALWCAIYVIDNYFFIDDAKEAVWRAR